MLEQGAKRSQFYSELYGWCAGPVHTEDEGDVLLFLTLQTRIYFSLQRDAPCFEPSLVADEHTIAQEWEAPRDQWNTTSK